MNNVTYPFLKSYADLESFREYLDAHIHPIEESEAEYKVFEQLLAVMGLLAIGKKTLDALDNFYANDYFKLALNIKHYMRFDLQHLIKMPAFQALLNQFSLWEAKQKTPIDTNRLAGFEGGKFDQQLRPALSFVSHFLQLNQQTKETALDPYRKIAFTEEMHQQFLQDGFLIIKDFINPKQLGTLRNITKTLAESALSQENAYLYGNHNKLQRVYNLLNKDAVYRQLICATTVQNILNTVFDRDTLHQKFYLSSFQANILNPGAEAQKLHVDSAVPDPLPPWLIRVNVNFLLEDFTETNGATLVLPGSHLYLRKPKLDDNPQMTKVIAPAGSIVMWTGHLWHQSGENCSNQSRTALLACFVASYLREVAIEENYLQVMSAENIANSPKILRDMLGVGHGIKQGA